MAKQDVVKQIRRATRRKYSAAFSPDGKRVVTGGHDFTACVWDTFTGERLMVLQGALGRLINVGYSRSGITIFATSSLSGALDFSIAWDAETGRFRERVPQAPWKFRTLGTPITPDHTRFASTDNSGEVTVGRYRNSPKPSSKGKPLYTWRAHDAEVLDMSFSHDGKRFVTAGKNGLAKIWRYRHPERWWGVMYLPAFWATALLSIALAWSLLRDRRILSRTASEPGNG